jgi:hypothetical protein
MIPIQRQSFEGTVATFAAEMMTASYLQPNSVMKGKKS